MHLAPMWVVAETVAGRLVATLDGDGTVALGPLELHVAGLGGPELRWSVANRGDGEVSVTSIGVVFAVEAAQPLRMLRHGYQSWSPTGVATLGVDRDPSLAANFPFLQAVHHADARTVADPGELRSEWFTVLADATGSVALVGFDAGTAHDGTLRLRPADGTGSGPVLLAEAFLGGAVLSSGEQRRLHDLLIDHAEQPVAPVLERWAARAGRASHARVDAEYQVGWCSWYHYFDEVTEADVRHNLAHAARWPFRVFQLDDGFQATIGDWLDTSAAFPSGLAAQADAIASAGMRPGLWLAPFLVAPDSRVALEHPDWLARVATGDEPLYAWWNPTWGGGRDGFVHALDTTHPDVLAHLERLARDLVDMGWTYLKLDFTFAPAVPGRWRDPTQTPAQRVRAGYDAIRRGAGPDAFLLACGAPLAPVVGVVDGCRIGQDVAPRWALPPTDEVVPGYLAIQPATRHAYGNTAARSFMHRRLWLNDPDCLMLRTSDTSLTPAAARTWADTVALSGGMAIVSDDLALLGADAARIIAHTVELGLTVDAAARAGRTPTAPDLLEHAPTTRFAAAGRLLVVDPDDGTSTLHATTDASAGTGPG